MKIHEAITGFFADYPSRKQLHPRTVSAYQKDLAQYVEAVADMASTLSASATATDRVGSSVQLRQPEEGTISASAEKAVLTADAVLQWEVERLPHVGPDEFVRYMAERGFAESSIKRKIASLKVFLQYCVEQGWLKDGPTRPEPRDPERMRAPDILSPEEAARLLDQPALLVDAAERRMIRHPQDIDARQAYEQALRDQLMIELLFGTGMRIGELSGLNLGDIDVARSAITIRGRGRRHRVLSVPTPELGGLLRRYLSLPRPGPIDAQQALFLNRKGERLSIHSVENIFRKYVRAARIQRHVTPHVLRHTLAARLVEMGVELRQVKKLLGHASLSTTQVYRRFGAADATGKETVEPDTSPVVVTLPEREAQARQRRLARGAGGSAGGAARSGSKDSARNRKSAQGADKFTVPSVPGFVPHPGGGYPPGLGGYPPGMGGYPSGMGGYPSHFPPAMSGASAGSTGGDPRILGVSPNAGYAREGQAASPGQVEQPGQPGQPGQPRQPEQPSPTPPFVPVPSAPPPPAGLPLGYGHGAPHYGYGGMPGYGYGGGAGYGYGGGTGYGYGATGSGAPGTPGYGYGGSPPNLGTPSGYAPPGYGPTSGYGTIPSYGYPPSGYPPAGGGYATPGYGARPSGTPAPPVSAGHPGGTVTPGNRPMAGSDAHAGPGGPGTPGGGGAVPAGSGAPPMTAQTVAAMMAARGTPGPDPRTLPPHLLRQWMEQQMAEAGRGLPGGRPSPSVAPTAPVVTSAPGTSPPSSGALPVQRPTTKLRKAPGEAGGSPSGAASDGT